PQTTTASRTKKGFFCPYLPCLEQFLLLKTRASNGRRAVSLDTALKHRLGRIAVDNYGFTDQKRIFLPLFALSRTISATKNQEHKNEMAFYGVQVLARAVKMKTKMGRKETPF
ncbi:MAG: hypothetical protein IKA53_04215, partial [Clostridia bacterium]|nr:hypothetical protein [Clostridia bacterium]